MYVDLEITERETKLAGDLHDVVEEKSGKAHEHARVQEPGNIVRNKYGNINEFQVRPAPCFMKLFNPYISNGEVHKIESQFIDRNTIHNNSKARGL